MSAKKPLALRPLKLYVNSTRTQRRLAQSPSLTDFRSCVLVQTSYSGELFNVSVADFPALCLLRLIGTVSSSRYFVMVTSLYSGFTRVHDLVGDIGLVFLG